MLASEFAATKFAAANRDTKDRVQPTVGTF